MVDAAVSMVLKRLGEMVKDEVNLHLLADTNMQMLLGKLEAIHKVLADAEQKGTMDPKVKSWLSKLQDIAYDIDDVLDEWNHEQLCEKYREEEEEGEEEETEEEDPSNPWDKVISFLQSVCFCFKHVVESRNVVEHVFERRGIAVKVRELNGRLDSVAEQNEKEFNFLPDLPHVGHEFQSIQTSSQVDVSQARGRDIELRDLESKLMGDRSNNDDAGSSSKGLGDGHNNTIQVISIVGSAGMGKTFLAQLAFQRVKDRFEETAWVCVSDPFDEIKIAKAILEDMTNYSFNLTQLNPLLKNIEKTVKKKKFLIVLDDVWLENQEKWAPFWNSLKGSGAPGSKILVTTRNTNVAKTMGSVVEDIIELVPLSDSDCWSILSRMAFQYKSPVDREMLETTGRLIANKCKGLPLAAKIIGSHLSSTTTSLEEWEKVLNSEVWEWDKANADLFPILRLSYSKLDPASKRCFTYCALYPKDFEYRVLFMKKSWIAHGFVPGRDATGVEINAQKIFDNLVGRSFFQDFVRKGISGCISGFKIHDIIYDFAVSLTNKECLTLCLDDEAPSEPYSFQNARHVRIDSTKSTPFSFIRAENVRTFVLFGTEPPENAFNLLKRVRLLVLRECKFVPEEVGDMIHLRCLQLGSKEGISELPGTICNLFELQSLSIDDCTNLRRFPQGIHKLQNLRDLIINEDIELPQGLEKLNNLRTLVTFGANKKNKLGYLQNMEQLRELAVVIKGLNDDDVVCEAEKANLKNKRFFVDFNLELDHSDGDISINVVEALQPPKKLSDLCLRNISKIPDWMATLTYLRKLLICGLSTVDWSHLSKLPALEKCLICCKSILTNVGHDFLGMEMAQRSPTPHNAGDRIAPSFPRLKELKFAYCRNWEEWEDITEEEEKNSVVSIFPSLEILKIYHCDELKVLPHRLLRKAPHLKFLRVKDSEYLRSRYNQNDGEDWNEILHISNVQIVE